jgi:hypothetical protein
MLLQVIDELHTDGISREEAFDFHEKVHRLAHAFLKSQPVVLRGGGRNG